ncbi:MAG: EamA family transporter [Anaerolinea sp.]|nr:EamA family transporter [Anaerolinea sp.]
MVRVSEAAAPNWGPLVLLAGVSATAWAAIFVRLADEAPPLTIAAYRLLIATGVVGGVALFRLKTGRDILPSRAAWPWLALSGLFLAGHFWSWFASLERTSVGSSVVIVAMQPLLAAALGFVFLKESPRTNEYWGIALATAGLLIIGGRDFAQSPGHLGGDALALLGGFLAAAYRTIGRHLRPEMGAAIYSAAVYGLAAVALWGLVAIFRRQASGFEADTWTFMVLLALVPQVIGHTAFNWALAHFRVVTVSITNMGEPVAATLLAIPILGEDPSRAVLIGGPFILAGVAVGLFGRPRVPVTVLP